jgi:hypothetical protein
MTHSPLKATVHTPGPWEVKGNILKCTGPYGKYLFKLEEMPGTGSEAEPNARLIAAAPDMLAALKAARDMLVHLSQSTDSYCEICESHAPKSPDPMGRVVGPVPHEPDCPLGMAESAIARAEGREP